VLAARREKANLRAALEIKYRPDLLAVIERMGLTCQPLEPILSGTSDPEARAAALGRAFEEAYSERERMSVAYTEGGHAREGAIILLGETAVDLARKAIAIAETYTAAP
jgi:predicted fused transcriptional regulator/phosphomethylpyrimidine kinase